MTLLLAPGKTKSLHMTETLAQRPVKVPVSSGGYILMACMQIKTHTHTHTHTDNLG